MKIILLLSAFMFGFGANVKKSADDMREMSKRNELNQYKHTNMLPMVEVVAERQ
jgi:hypothetical protein